MTCQISLSSAPSSSSWSSCGVDSSSSRLPTVTVSSLIRLSSSSYQETSTRSAIFSDTMSVGVRSFCDSRKILDYPSPPSLLSRGFPFFFNPLDPPRDSKRRTDSRSVGGHPTYGRQADVHAYFPPLRLRRCCLFLL